MTKFIKRLSAVAVVLCLLVSMLSGCGKAAGHITVDGKNVGIDYALKIGDYEVSMAEYRYYFMNLKSNYFDNGDDTYWDTYPEDEATLLEYTLNYIKSQYSALVYADSLGLKFDDADTAAVDSQISTAIESLGSEEDYAAALNESFMSPDLYRLMLEQYQMQQKVNTYLFGEGGPMEIKEADEKQLIQDNYVHVMHLVYTDQASAEAALARINAGEDMANMIEESDNQDTSETTDGYTFTKGEMATDFENAAFALSENQVSGIISASYGYQIIKRLPLSDDYINTNFDDMINSIKSQKLYDELNVVAEGLEVQYNKNYDKFGVKTILNDGVDTVNPDNSMSPLMIIMIAVGCAIVAAVIVVVVVLIVVNKKDKKPTEPAEQELPDVQDDILGDVTEDASADYGSYEPDETADNTDGEDDDDYGTYEPDESADDSADGEDGEDE